MGVILGIDPGTRITGFAAVSSEGRRIVLIDSGTIKLDGHDPLSERLGALQRQLEEILDRTAPAEMAIEDVFSHRNARSALLLGHARGVVLATAARRGLAVHTYAPASIKQAVAGHGRAEKVQIQRMVQSLLGIDRLPGRDEADAMATALCHVMAGRRLDLHRADQPRVVR